MSPDLVPGDWTAAVGYLDVLGVRIATDNSDRVGALMEGWERCYDRVEQYLDGDSGVGLRIFTDCCVVYARGDPADDRALKMTLDSKLMMVARLLQEFAVIFAAQGFVVRGGLACGTLVESKLAVFGTGVERSYKLEQSDLFGRLNVDPSVLDWWGRQGAELTVPKATGGIVALDRYGGGYIDYLRATKVMASVYSVPEAELLASHRQALELLEAHVWRERDLQNRQRSVVKLMWLEDYHNSACEARGLQGERYTLTAPDAGKP